VAGKRYRPDFLIRLVSGDMLVLETKGQDKEEDRLKREFLDEWVRAVNAHGGFGRWKWAVARQPGEILDILTPTADAVRRAESGTQRAPGTGSACESSAWS
jgi:type III restriction enzyme